MAHARSTAWRRAIPVALAFVVLSRVASAHAGHDQNSFTAGFLHPVHGLDHLLAMVTVGLLSARMEPRRMWMLPAAFVAMMSAGGLLGLALQSGAPAVAEWNSGLSVFEWGIGLSVLAFGAVAAVAPSVPVLGGNLIVATFAICHGHAHVAEMGDATAWGYFPGMLTCTALLHLGGLIVGVGMKRALGEWSVRLAGAGVAVAFAVILTTGGMS